MGVKFHQMELIGSGLDTGSGSLGSRVEPRKVALKPAAVSWRVNASAKLSLAGGVTVAEKECVKLARRVMRLMMARIRSVAREFDARIKHNYCQSRMKLRGKVFCGGSSVRT